jgi:Na+-transporting methylmalonyl-CoA/oxaloacetate decarboxylase gamma subunit
MRFFLLLSALMGTSYADVNAIQKITSDHGVSLAISGMVIVFFGLAAIALFISALPKVLKWMEQKGLTPAAHGHGHNPAPAQPKAAVASVDSSDSLDAGLLAAITLVLHAESERALGQQLKVTIGLNPSPWALSSHMRVIPGRIKS